MKKITFLTATAVALIFVASCGRNVSKQTSAESEAAAQQQEATAQQQPEPQQPDEPDVTVYVVGHESNKDGETFAVLWKNGKPIRLPGNKKPDEIGIGSIFITEDNTVCVAGEIDYTAVFWKVRGNDVETFDLDVSRGSYVASICGTRSGDVYLAGEDNGEPVIWKISGSKIIKQTLSAEDLGSVQVSSMYITPDGDIYVTGYRIDQYTAVLWKNGKEQRMAEAKYAEFTDVYVTGEGVVYVVGGRNPKPTLWINGTPQPLFDYDDEYSTMIPQSLFVTDNGDIYTAGYNYPSDRCTPIVIKNKIKQILDYNGWNAIANSVFVTPGGDVYVTGKAFKDKEERAILWINGTPRLLADGAALSSANCVFVTQKTVSR